MQLHLLAIVGNGVGVVLVATLADEVAIVIIAAEKRDKMREHLVVRAVGCASQCRFHLRQKFELQEVFYLRPLLVHDAVYAKIQFGMVHHEYLL